MTFAHPVYLAEAAAACGLLFWVWRRHDLRQSLAIESLLAPHLRAQLTRSISRPRRIAQRALFGAAIALAFVALACPQGGFRWEQSTRRGNDIMFAVDTSRSMLTPDVKPTRLARAKLAIDDFVNHLDGDAVGLVAFAGTAFLQTPMTLDYGAFHESLSALDTHIIPVGGTNISSAIRETAVALHDRSGGDKILILVTDGEDLQGDALTAARTAAKQEGLKIYTVGVGTPNGDLIPLPPDQGAGYLKQADGTPVKSRLDETALRALAAATGGSYAPLGNTNQGLETIYREALAPLAKHDLQSQRQKVYTQLFQYPLAVSLALLVSSLLMGTRRRNHKVAIEPPAATPGRLVWPVVAMLLVAAVVLPLDSARASVSSAVKAYDNGNFADAAQEFSKAAQSSPYEPVLKFDAGAAAYKAGDYTHATQSFQDSLNEKSSGDAKRLAEQEDAYYNLGNSLYREGEKTQPSDAAKTLATWGRSIKAYKAALQLRADDPDSKFNRDLVQRKIDALTKQQQQKQQQNQSQQNQSLQGSKSLQSSSQKPSAGQQSKSASQPNAGQGTSEQPKDKPEGKSGAKGAGQAGTQPPGAGGKAGDKQQTESEASDQGAAQPPTSGRRTLSGSEAGGGSSPRAGEPDGAAQAGAAQTDKAADDQRLPGQMSRAEARELLDSVKDEQQRLPTAPLARSGEADEAPSEQPVQDW